MVLLLACSATTYGARRSVAERSFYQRGLGLGQVTGGSGTRRPAQPSASQRRATPRVKVSVSLGNQVIQLAGTSVFLDLPIPSVSRKFLKPRLELCKLLWSESTDG